jgi:release factor glutamine methyltransferase
MMKAIEKLREISRTLRACGIEAPEKEAEILIRYGAGIDTVEIYRDNPELSKEQMNTIEEMVSRRSIHEPLQYILGYEEFLGLQLILGEGVLIPRPETEFMAEQAIKQLTVNSSQLKVLDLCTGSGCIALAIAKEFPQLQVYGSDISKVAIDYARRNAWINNIKNVTFLRGDLFEPFKPARLFDLIVSNPPYIRTDDIKNLQPEIRQWEPLNAIDGGSDGLNFYRKIIPEARWFLKDNGALILEIGDGYIKDITEMIKYAGYIQTEVMRDYAQIERIILARWKKQ